jgi:hypothetical protein
MPKATDEIPHPRKSAPKVFSTVGKEAAMSRLLAKSMAVQRDRTLRDEKMTVETTQCLLFRREESGFAIQRTADFEPISVKQTLPGEERARA